MAFSTLLSVAGYIRTGNFLGLPTYYCFHLQVKNHVMLVCQCRPLLNEVMALVMLSLFCGSSVVFPVIVRNSLRWVNSVHGKFIIF